MYLMQGALIADASNVSWTYGDPDPTADYYPGGSGLVATETITIRSLGGGGGSTLPATPAEALFDEANPGAIVTLDETGAGKSSSLMAVASALGVSLALPREVRDAVAWLDAETLPNTTAGTPIRTWPNLKGDPARLFAGTAPTLDTAAPGALDYSAAGGLQRVENLPMVGGASRSLAVWLSKGPTYGKKWLVTWGYLYGLYLYGDTPQVEHGTGPVLDAGFTIDGDPHLLVSTYDGNVGRLYVDGVLADTKTYGVLPTTSLPLAIASRGDILDENYNGKLHAVGAWERTLTAADVSALYTWIAGRNP